MNSTDIANMALSAIGNANLIANLTEQSAEAQAVNLHYTQVLRELLRVANWPFARANEALSVLLAKTGTPENLDGTELNEPEWPWTYAYGVPSDCVKIRSMVPQATTGAATVDGIPLTTASAAPFNVRTPPIRFIESTMLDTVSNSRRRILLTHQYQARLVYTSLIEDPTLWDANFVTAFIGRLAGKICMPLSGDKKLMQMAAQSGAVAESEARTAMANESIDVQDWTPETLAAHGYDDPDASDLYLTNAAQEIT